MPLHHSVQFRLITSHDRPETTLVDLPKKVWVGPARVFAGDVDLGVVFVPAGEVWVRLGFNGAEGTVDEADNARDAGFAVCCNDVRGRYCSSWWERALRETRTSVDKQHLDAKVCSPNAHQEYLVCCIKL